MGSPFGLSFEEIKAQADANMQADKGQGVSVVQSTAAVETTAQPGIGNKTFLEMVEEAESVLAGENETEASVSETATSTASAAISFDDMYAQANSTSASAVSAASFDDLFAQANESKAVSPETTTQQTNIQSSATNQAGNAQTMSFDDLMATAQAETATDQTANAPAVSFDDLMANAQTETATDQTANTPAVSFDNVMANVKAETATDQAANVPAVSFDNVMAEIEAQTGVGQGISETEFDGCINKPVIEEPVAAEALKVAEEPVAAEVPKVAEEPVATETSKVAEEPVATETSKVAEEPQKKRAGGRRSKKTVEFKEPLPDITEDYKVDILGENKKEAEPMAQTDEALSMGSLFTQEEINAFRADIRTFVRKEFKRAMVGAVKELLTEFSE